METVFEKIRQLANPYLDTRKNDIHTRISTELAFELLRREGGDNTIVIPAILLHDVGWKKVPEHLHLKAFGPKATSPELNRIHEKEGVKIARDILQKLSYEDDKVEEILEIIDGHDSRMTPTSPNDSIVKDADKLWRYTKSGFRIDVERFGENPKEALMRLQSNLDSWFFTESAKKIARNELGRRAKEEQIELS
jgi:HD superfamily phosphodiesterase